MKKLLLLSLFVNLFPASVALAEDIDAQVAWSQRVELTTGVSGTVAKVNVQVGDRVKAGEQLLVLDQNLFRASLSRAMAQEKDAQYKLKEAEREWERARELYDRTVLSDRDLQLAENDLVSAQADMATATAALTHAKHNLAESVVRAPMNAIVLERQAEPGQAVVNKLQVTPLITVASADSYLARGEVSASTADELAAGQAVSVTVAGTRYKGKVFSVGLEPVGQGNTYPLSIQFSAGNKTLRAGEPAIIHLP